MRKLQTSGSNLCTVNQGKIRSSGIWHAKEIMWKKVGIVRNKENLERAIEELQRIREENLPSLHVSKNREFLEALEIMNGLVVGELVDNCAIFRTESRGAHYRSDYTKRDDKTWLKNIVIKRNEDKESPYPVIITKDVPRHLSEI